MPQVWAPEVKKVELFANGRDWQMQCDDEGWWFTDEAVLPPGTDYGFRVDGSAPLPDPRSPWQPYGVHGLSRTVDHREFQWTDENWQARPLAATILYEIHVGTFTPEGTFEAAIERLDHLKRLGVTHIELMPVAEFEGDYGWGYDGAALYAPHHAYGGPLGLKYFVNACHQRGLGVVLDVVYNHLGPTGNYLPRYAPYFQQGINNLWGSALNFSGPYSDEVRRYFCDNSLMWLRDYHIDGLRLDAVHAVVDHSAIHFLEQLATEVDELKAHLGRHLVLIAESDLNDPRVVRPWELGGFGFDAQWSDDIHHALHTVLTGEREGYYADFGSIEDLCTSMQRPFVYAGRHSEFRGHRHGRPPIGLSAHRFVAYLQNHDQLGNRAQGERISHLTSDDRVRIGAALLLTSPYVPMLFQGEEWRASSPFQYFVDFKREPELAKAVAEGRIREFASFGWRAEEVPDPTDPATFMRSKLNWDELQLPQHAGMFAWYRQLIELRCQLPDLRTGRLDFTSSECSEAEKWLRVDRGCVTIACNFADTATTIPLPGAHHWQVLLTHKEPLAIHSSEITLPPESVAILQAPGKQR